MAAPVFVRFVEQNGQRYYTLFACISCTLKLADSDEPQHNFNYYLFIVKKKGE